MSYTILSTFTGPREKRSLRMARVRCTCGRVREIPLRSARKNKYGCRACAQIIRCAKLREQRRIRADEAYSRGREPGLAANDVTWQAVEPSTIETLDDFFGVYCATNQLHGQLYAAVKKRTR